MRLILALLVLLPLPARAQDILSSLIHDLEAGIVCAPEVIDTMPAPDTVAGVTNIIEVLPPFVSDSRIVPAVIGLGFAVTSRAATKDLIGVHMELTHPPMGPDGITRQSYVTDIFATDGSFALYQFEQDYELVEGPWTMTATLGKTPLWQVAFTLVAPDLVPELAEPCGYTDLLS